MRDSSEQQFYAGDDLEALAELPNYQEWILSAFRPYVRGAVLEYGSGIGTISKLLAPHAGSLTLVEPARNLIPRLSANFSGRPGIEIVNGTLESHAAAAPTDSYDAVVMVNVLEHVENDREALLQLKRILRPGGHLLAFVPALSWLMSDLDRRLGHFRRYGRPELMSKAREAGFTVLDARYFDLAGVIPWFVINRLGGATGVNSKLATLYDSYAVPLGRRLEGVISPPVGKNVILIARA